MTVTFWACSLTARLNFEGTCKHKLDYVSALWCSCLRQCFCLLHEEQGSSCAHNLMQSSAQMLTNDGAVHHMIMTDNAGTTFFQRIWSIFWMPSMQLRLLKCWMMTRMAMPLWRMCDLLSATSSSKVLQSVLHHHSHHKAMQHSCCCPKGVHVPSAFCHL